MPRDVAIIIAMTAICGFAIVFAPEHARDAFVLTLGAMAGALKGRE